MSVGGAVMSIGGAVMSVCGASVISFRKTTPEKSKNVCALSYNHIYASGLKLVSCAEPVMA
jgi:hypothetical protein